MRCRFLALLTITIILWTSPETSAVVENVDDVFVVEYVPSSFDLRPDEEGILVFDVENVGNETWMVALRFTRVESGHTRAEIRPSLFELEANASQRVTITIETRAKYGQEPGSSDFKIRMYWGKNITQSENSWVDEDAVEGKRIFEFMVSDDLSNLETNIRIFIAIIILLVITGVWLVIWKRRRTPPNNR